jgi:hypothetical protein
VAKPRAASYGDALPSANLVPVGAKGVPDEIDAPGAGLVLSQAAVGTVGILARRLAFLRLLARVPPT